MKLQGFAFPDAETLQSQTNAESENESYVSRLEVFHGQLIMITVSLSCDARAFRPWGLPVIKIL